MRAFLRRSPFTIPMVFMASVHALFFGMGVTICLTITHESLWGVVQIVGGSFVFCSLVMCAAIGFLDWVWGDR